MDVENKMVIDSLWNDLDEIDEAEREEMEEDFYIRADLEYEDEIDRQLSWYAWSRENDGYYL